MHAQYTSLCEMYIIMSILKLFLISKINKQKPDILLCKQNIAMFALNYPFCLDIPLVWLENGSGNLSSIWCEGQLCSHSFSLSEYGHPQIKSNYTGTQSTECRILIQQCIVSRLECMSLGCSRDAHLSTVSSCSYCQRKINKTTLYMRGMNNLFWLVNAFLWKKPFAICANLSQWRE